jgi:tRNA(Ile)-lysidine synthase
MPRAAPLPDPIGHLLALTGAKPRIAIAFSGGLDSTVLAHALAKARSRLGSLRLLHVDHGLQAASALWAKHCVKQARRWRVPVVTLRVSIRKKRGDSPEAAARDARYAALADTLEPGEILVTAQHQDDQAETLLLQLFRGAGVAGLAAMPSMANFARGRIARPLLTESRASLAQYAQRHELEWIEDPSNEQTRFARNFVRHEVLPVIREKWPSVEASLARSARNMSDAQCLLSAAGRADLWRVMDGDGLNVSALRALTPARRRNALREFIAAAGIEPASSAKMAEIAGSLLTARVDAQPEVRWSDCVMRRRSGRLELQVVSELPIEVSRENTLKSWRWRHEREFVVNSLGERLMLIEDASGPIDLDRLPDVLHLRPRAGGETLRPGPRSRTQTLKNLLQSARIPPKDRARVPLLFVGDGLAGRLVAVGDRWIDASIAADVKSSRRARLRLRRC